VISVTYTQVVYAKPTESKLEARQEAKLEAKQEAKPESKFQSICR
jgi:hypothetical protein